eukprot:COSAG06_NODE_13724_length_1225_cov_1.288632_2_plen_131_part_00
MNFPDTLLPRRSSRWIKTAPLPREYRALDCRGGHTTTVTVTLHPVVCCMYVPGRSATRLVIVNENMPGVLGAITTACGTAGLNILQTVNTSRGDIAYNVVDFSRTEVSKTHGNGKPVRLWNAWLSDFLTF